MKKIITLTAGKKLPIPGKQFSNVEASAHYTIEYESGDHALMLHKAKEMLSKCLQASMEVANNTEPEQKPDKEMMGLADKLARGRDYDEDILNVKDE